MKKLAEGDYLLQRFQGKGGWTYAEIPGVEQDRETPFGWVKVRGEVDKVPFKGVKLAPMGNGRLFFPLKAELRKKLGKQEGDTVRIVLYKDDMPLEIPLEIMECLQMEHGAYEKFTALTEGRQKEFINWIYAAKREETRVERINTTIYKVLNNEPFYIPKEQR